MEVHLCTSCIRSSADVQSQIEVQKFIEDVQKVLSERCPEVPWCLLATGCQRFCPADRITLVIASRLLMSREASVAGVAEQILRIHARSSGNT
ncbi:MAG: hypothetical protein HUU57_06060 [Bdellovibrio sp.]|nr:hypothetical protein [Bdellovibrio sp.]